jgi:hypothetical protein
MIVHVAKNLGTFQKTICRPGCANEHSGEVHFSQCIHEWNSLFSFKFFKHEKYFIGNVETNADGQSDGKKEKNFRYEFDIFFHNNPMIKIEINAARNPAIKPCWNWRLFIDLDFNLFAIQKIINNEFHQIALIGREQ